MSARIVIRRHGGPEVLELEDLPPGDPGPGQVRLRTTAIGVNFIDVYHRLGRYPQPLPFTPGGEVAGVVDALGPGVTDLALGQRVAGFFTSGGYAAHVVIPAVSAIPIPVGVTDEQAAAATLQGMTAHYLCNDTFTIGPGDTALVHAAAGGTGLLLTQLIKARGGRVLATVSTEAKAALALGAGADHVIRYTEQDFAAEARRLTAGRGVDVVYDSVGKTTFAAGLTCLRPRGVMVLFGAASGPVPPLDPLDLMRGSHYLTRPTLHHYVAAPAALHARATAVFTAIAAGTLHLRIDRRDPLADARHSHAALESRATTGKLLLIP
jgi:NADPH2:quinone reductase